MLNIKNILIIALLLFGFGSIVYAAPYFRQEATLIPISNNAYDLGTSTKAWRNIYSDTTSSSYFTATSTTATSTLPRLTVGTGLSLFGTYGQTLSDFCTAITGGSGLCDGTDATGSGGAAAVATSSAETAGQLAYWTSTAGTPALLGKVATSSLTATAPLALSNVVSFIGAVGSAISCAVATGSVSGCLSSTDWNTFNAKQATISTTFPITLSGATVAFNGLSTSTPAVVGNLPYFSGVNTFANVATTSVVCSGNTTCSPFTAIGASPITISSTGGGTGLSTTTPISDSNVLVYSSIGAGASYGVATGTASCTTGASCSSFTVIGSSPSITTTLGTSVDLASEVTGTLPVGNGGTGAATFGQGWLHSAGGTNIFTASTSPTVNYITATSTTATSTFSGILSVLTRFITVIAAAFTPTTEGEIGIDTTSNQMKYYSGAAVRVLDPVISSAFVYATSTMGTGTTTLKVSGYTHGTTFTKFGCTSSGTGTFVAVVGDSTSSSTPVTSSTTNTTTFTTLSSNNVFTAGEALWYAIGSVSGTVVNPSCSYGRSITAD